MGRPNVVLLVIDSLRKVSLGQGPGYPRTPFLDSLSSRTISFARAHATECWTLPTHLSMFTGLLPSEHGAHFRSMAYTGKAPTIAEILSEGGYHTESITRNSLFDGTVPGATRGFQRLSRPLAPIDPRSLAFLAVLALAKPRVRRLIRGSGFFHAAQKANREFLTTLARMGLPADRLALAAALERMAEMRRKGRPYFLFLNLYDVHAPYCPTETSPLPRLRSLAAVRETLALPRVLPKIASHAHLRPGFRMSERSRQMLLDRYHSAIELMDEKIAWFYEEARSAGYLDDTLLVVTSDHGEGFGEHGLYLHDASAYETHLHVPLWVHHPERPPEAVDEVVSTRGIFELLGRAAERGGYTGTILDAVARERVPYAVAEHFHYPHPKGVLPEYRGNRLAVVTREAKVVRSPVGLERFDLERDPGEFSPEPVDPRELEACLRRDGVPADDAASIACVVRGGAGIRKAA
jgi:arylsulfatase A-like enzyme